jgi:ribosomal protein S14
MAGRYLLLSDLKKRSMMFRREPHSILLHCLFNEHTIYTNDANVDFLHEPVFHYAHYLSFKRSHGSMFRSKARNRCLYNGSARAVFKSYKMSRMTFKHLARTGSLNGVTKAS